MSKKIKIAVDAMGGDGSPKKLLTALFIIIKNQETSLLFLVMRQKLKKIWKIKLIRVL